MDVSGALKGKRVADTTWVFMMLGVFGKFGIMSTLGSFRAPGLIA